MPSYTLRPGGNLADRYRLEESLGAAGEATSWRAFDGLLHRSVGVHTLPAAAPGAETFLAAARAAAQLVDPRFLRVLDANTSEDVVYVVTEWIDAKDLAALVAGGPMPATEAARLAGQVASGLAAAHAMGLSHTRLRPGSVLRSDNGSVKIAGLAVDDRPGVESLAARDGSAHPPDGLAAASFDPAREDARGCGAVLYAALTGRWPGSAVDGLPAAPDVDGHVCAPRQVRAGVPAELDDIACRALGIGRRGADLLASPAAVAEALHAASAVPILSPTIPVAAIGVGDADQTPTPFAAPPRPGTMSRVARAGVAAVVATGVALGGWQLALAAQDRSGDPRPPASEGSEPAQTPAAPGAVVVVAGVSDFDPQGTDGDENGDRVGQAIDDDPDTSWTTSTYQQQFGPGGLKDGVGLVVDLGERRRVSTVSLELDGRGTGVELGAADRRPEDRAGFATIADSPASGPTITLRPDPVVESRFLLVWLTELPEVEPGAFRGGVAEITVRS